MIQGISELANWLSLICTSIAAIGCIYAVAAGLLTRRFAQQTVTESKSYSNVTILKPLHGMEHELRANLMTFCRQDYPAEVQIIFGVQHPNDPAIAVVHGIMEALPEADIRLVVNASLHGTNRKVSNLINMSKDIKHDVIVLADSDMAVEDGYLRKVVDALQQPGVGLVTCLYKGHGANGIWSQIAAMGIEFHFLPSVIVGLATGLARPCFGSTIALRAETLREIGGFQSVANRLADDHALGQAVSALGLRTSIPPFLVSHTCADDKLAGLFRHELRWVRTIQIIDPVGYVGSGVTHALPFALLAAVLGGFSAPGLYLVALALASRLYLQLEVSRRFGLPRALLWFAPIRDMLSFAVYLACFFSSRIDWRGQSFTVTSDGTLVPSAPGQQRKVG